MNDSAKENARVTHRTRLSDFYIKAYVVLTGAFVVIGLIGWLL